MFGVTKNITQELVNSCMIMIYIIFLIKKKKKKKMSKG